MAGTTFPRNLWSEQQHSQGTLLLISTCRTLLRPWVCRVYTRHSRLWWAFISDNLQLRGISTAGRETTGKVEPITRPPSHWRTLWHPSCTSHPSSLVRPTHPPTLGTRPPLTFSPQPQQQLLHPPPLPPPTGLLHICTAPHLALFIEVQDGQLAVHSVALLVAKHPR